MKRSSQQGPPSKASSKSSGVTKIKDMQKAYGVAAKAGSSPSTTKVKSLKNSSGTGEDKVVGGSGTGASSHKSRSSLGANLTASSSKAYSEPGGSTARKSYPPDASTKNSSSKIMAASKANYAEKYGTGGGGSPSRVKVAKGSGAGASITSNSSHRKASSNNNNSSSPQKVPSTKSSNSSTTSRLTNQKPPPALYESEATEDYGEEFEEDYESDFEQGNSTEDESEARPSRIQTQKDPEMGEDTISKNGEELDKSSSIREFEKLEKMVEVEEFHVEQKPSMKMNKERVMNGYGGGSGEPVASITTSRSGGGVAPDEGSEEEDESEDDKSSLPESPLVKKQNAFPVTSGFSISTSLRNEQQQISQEQQRKSSGRDKVPSAGRSNLKAMLKEPGQENKIQMRRRTDRGKIIQGMIKLDRVGVDIFHLAPYPYERFMTVFSGADRLQTSTQTDQDRSVESVQTDPIEQTTKWTQKPPTWSTTSSSCDIRIVRQEALGVGSDDISEDLNSPDQKIYKQFEFLQNWEQLSKFIIRASRKMLYVLEAEERIKLPSNSGKKGSLETIKMNRGLSVLSKLEMHTLAGDGECVGCANGAPYFPLDDNKENKSTNGNKKQSKNLITVWSLKEPSMPLYFLRVWGHVSALKVHMIGRMIIAGNKDGSLNVWNLDESLCYHSQYQDQVIRTPSVNTSCMEPTHVSPIVGIEMFSDTKNTFSVVSIDKEGLVITWSCLRSHDTLGESSMSQYSSAWSTIHMSVRHQIQLDQITRDHPQLTCFSAYLDVEGSTTGFYFGTFNGYVAKGQVIEDGGGGGSGSKAEKGNASATIVKFHERIDTNPKVTCMDVSTTLNILAVGCEDGRCRLFEMSRKKLVLSLGGKEEPIRVKWSGRRASVLYVALKESLLVWDLLTSDMNPWKTIHLKDIRDFVLYSPPHKEYLVIISGKDLIISTPAEEVRPLSSRDFSRIQSYFSLLC